VVIPTGERPGVRAEPLPDLMRMRGATSFATADANFVSLS
jgi:hypothetical protein